MGSPRIAGVIGLVLFSAYFAPIAIKLKEWPLAMVILGGLVLALFDFWESMRD